MKDDSGSGDDSNAPLIETKNGSVSEMASDMNQLGGISDEYLNDEKHSQHQTLLRKLLGIVRLVIPLYLLFSLYMHYLNIADICLKSWTSLLVKGLPDGSLISSSHFLFF